MASMKSSGVLVDAFGRIRDIVGGVLDGMDVSRFNRRRGDTVLHHGLESVRELTGQAAT